MVRGGPVRSIIGKPFNNLKYTGLVELLVPRLGILSYARAVFMVIK